MSKLYEQLVKHMEREKKASGKTSELFDEISQSYFSYANSSHMDQILSGVKIGGKSTSSVKNTLSQYAQNIPYTSWPPKAGSRVAFSENVEALFAYKNPPAPGQKGTVVKVRTARGDSTHDDGRVFVKWDDGSFSAIHKDHLKASSLSENSKTASCNRIMLASLGDLGDFFSPSATSSNDLVHKATKDLWSLQEVEGEYVLERLFDDNGEPLKV